MKNIFLFTLFFCLTDSLAAQQRPSATADTAVSQASRDGLEKKIDLLEKKMDLLGVANDISLKQMQLGIDKQLFFLDPLILAVFGLSSIGGLFYIIIFYVPRKVREETSKRIALMTDADRQTVSEIIAKREAAKVIKKRARLNVLCADDGQRANAKTLLKDIMGFQNLSFNLDAKADLLIFYDPTNKQDNWNLFNEQMEPNNLNLYYFYFGPERFTFKHENLNYSNSKFTLENQLLQSLTLHPDFCHAA